MLLVFVTDGRTQYLKKRTTLRLGPTMFYNGMQREEIVSIIILIIFFYRITENVDKDSKEAKKFLKDEETKSQQQNSNVIGQKRPGGLSSIMQVKTYRFI